MPIDVERYEKQIKEELELIQSKGFIRYFLIVADLIQWAKENGVYVGPGRGSVTGSVIAYLLGITDIDPIVHGTNFSRFLNISRDAKSLPDIDVDFSDKKRDVIVSRLKTLYGENNICSVATYLRIEDKTAIRDVSRVYDIPLKEVDAFSKVIIEDIETALETVEGKEFKEKYPDIVRHALKLRGQYRSYGRHAAAQIISSEDLTLGTRAALVERNGNLTVAADMESSEFSGLLKLDVLGLSNLTIISHCLDLIKQNHGKNIDLSKIELTDRKVFKELSNGNTIGVFQFNTWAMTRLSKDMGIDGFKEMVAALALVRPGPMDSGITERYIKNKRTGKWDRKHEVYEKITEETYGELIFQEQLLDIFNKIAGLHPGIAEKIRKVVGKKRDAAEFEPYRVMFVEGCAKVGYFSEEEANDYWESLLKFARYGFSKNHAVAYAKISYDCCWLRTHYASEFLAAALSFGGEAEKPNLLKEAQRLNLQIVPPKIETSHPTNWVVKENRLFVPFLECKGLGPKNIEIITQYQKSLVPGFFQTEKPIIKGKLLTILNDIGAFSEHTPDSINQYFSLGISLTPETTYKKLFDLIKDTEYTQYNINDLLTGNFKNGKFAREIKDKTQINGLFQCCACELRSGCDKPSLPVIGDFNVAIFNEQPSWNSERDEKYLFKELLKYGFQKSDFYISNIIKCSSKKKINKDHISACADKFLTTETEKIRIVLAFGNAGVQAFHEGEEKVSKLNGTCEWNDKYGVFVVYSIPPGWPLWKDDFKPKFREAIKVFADKLESVGGFV